MLLATFIQTFLHLREEKPVSNMFNCTFMKQAIHRIYTSREILKNVMLNKQETIYEKMYIIFKRPEKSFSNHIQIYLLNRAKPTVNADSWHVWIFIYRQSYKCIILLPKFLIVVNYFRPINRLIIKYFPAFMCLYYRQKWILKNLTSYHKW